MKIQEKKLTWILAGLTILFWILSFRITSLVQPLSHSKELTALLMGMFTIFGIFLFFSSQKTFLFFVLLASFGSQLIFLFDAPYFNDFFRYLWNGKIIANGIHPFAFSPLEIVQQPETEIFQEVWYWDNMFFHWMRSIYGPATQLVFGIAGFIKQDSALVLKFLFFLCNAGTLLLGTTILKFLKRDVKYIALLALNPLFLFETLSTAHSEAILVFLGMMTLFFFLQKKHFWTGLSFSFFVSTKFFPILIAPLLIKQYFFSDSKKMKFHVQIKNFALFMFGGLFGVAILWLPLIWNLDSELLFESLKQFQKEWIQSPGIFALLQGALEKSVSSEVAYSIAKKMGIYIPLFVVGVGFFRQKKPEDLPTNILLVFSALLLFSSVVFSWYILWILFLTPFIRHPAPILILSLTIIFQYLLVGYSEIDKTFVYKENGEVLWNQLFIWLPPLFAVLFFQFKNAKK